MRLPLDGAGSVCVFLGGGGREGGGGGGVESASTCVGSCTV